MDVQIDDCDLGEGEDSIGIDIRASWANRERKGEELRRRIQIYARDGHIEFEHQDDVIYKSRETDVPLDVQYHIGYGRDGQGIPFDEKDIHASFDAVVAKVDTLMANLPERETILPKDIKSLHELRLSRPMWVIPSTNTPKQAKPYSQQRLQHSRKSLVHS